MHATCTGACAAPQTLSGKFCLAGLVSNFHATVDVAVPLAAQDEQPPPPPPPPPPPTDEQQEQQEDEQEQEEQEEEEDEQDEVRREGIC